MHGARWSRACMHGVRLQALLVGGRWTEVVVLLNKLFTQEACPCHQQQQHVLMPRLVPRHWVQSGSAKAGCDRSRLRSAAACAFGPQEVKKLEPPNPNNGKQGLKAPAMSSSTKEVLADTATQLIGFYAIMTSCLLLIFVPQLCPSSSAPDAHACSMSKVLASDLPTHSTGVEPI